MILPDTSIWIDHFRTADPTLAGRLEADRIFMHPYVLGELMLGGLHRRSDAFLNLRSLPAADVATAHEIQTLIEVEGLDGQGVGYVDVALLASARLRPGTKLWTRDRRLARVAAAMSLAPIDS